MDGSSPNNLSVRQRIEQQKLRAMQSHRTAELSATKVGRLEVLSCEHRGPETGTIPCGCGSPPVVFQCLNPQAVIRSCVKYQEHGKRQTAIEASGVAICELCQIRQKKPDSYDSVQEWREAKARAIQSQFETLPEMVSITPFGA